MRQEIEKHKVALVIILSLLVLKFLVVPVIDWQDQELSSIQLLKNKQSRIVSLLENAEATGELEKNIDSLLATTDEVFLTTSSSKDFQLSQQQWLENKISEFDLSLQNIGWSNQQSIDDLKAVGYNVQLNLNGRTVNIIRFIQAIQSQIHFIELQSFSFNFKRQRKGSFGQARIRLNLTIYRWDNQGGLGD